MELYKRQKGNLENIKREHVVLSLAEYLFILSLVWTPKYTEIKKTIRNQSMRKIVQFLNNI